MATLTTRYSDSSSGLAAAVGIKRKLAGADSYREPGARIKPGHLDPMLSSRPAHRGVRSDVAIEDERLILAARERDEEAWSAIFDANFQPLYRYAYYRTGDQSASEELAAQVFEEALRGIKRFEYRGVSISAWLFTIARNLVASHLASRAHLKQTVLPETIPAEDELAMALDEEALTALRSLPNDQQQVISLTLLEDLSPRDCAEVMGKTVRQVHALQFQALRQLRIVITHRRVAR
ncbi:MAG TPA: sigma-70 family RNA polymerase sigma factor [Dehalococcoidia bacterium]|nr:sigma-70 family RNA polymerase sigma factor [Dehalococcoidia bacterium]